MVGGWQGMYGDSVHSAQFCREPRAVLKNSGYFFKICNTGASNSQDILLLK